MLFSIGLALDVISKCAFSIDTDATNNPDDDLLKNGRNVFADFTPTNWLETLAFVIPTAYLPIIFEYVPLITDAQKWLFKLCTNIMKVRDVENTGLIDFSDSAEKKDNVTVSYCHSIR